MAESTAFTTVAITMTDESQREAFIAGLEAMQGAEIKNDPVPTTVWIAESGAYEERGICGIFDSVERAMGAFSGSWKRTFWCTYPEWPNTSKRRYWQEWSNGDVDVRPWSMEVDGPLGKVDKTIIQTLRTDGRWDYLDATPETLADAMAHLENDG